MTPELHEYVVARGARQDAALQRVERETEALGDVAVMQIAPDEGALLTLLVRSIGARRALELGTFTGYSAICIARGLPPDGKLICSELDECWAAVARANLDRAGVAERVDVRVGPARDTLAALPETEPLDFAFVDADKTSYPDYYEQIVTRLRPGGLAVLDNVLLRGRVLAADGDETAAVVDGLNRRIAEDRRVDLAMLGVADGVTVVRKR
jgi:caffeoyl-CoA O-methyltransferase